MDTPRTLYKITPTSPGSEAAAESAAALAAASIVFKDVDSAYSASLLSHSKSVSQYIYIHIYACFFQLTQFLAHKFFAQLLYIYIYVV